MIVPELGMCANGQVSADNLTSVDTPHDFSRVECQAGYSFGGFSTLAILVLSITAVLTAAMILSRFSELGSKKLIF